MGQTFTNGVLLRIRRQYSHDEAIGFISQRLSEREVEVGVLKSEIAELKFLLKQQKKAEKRRAKEIAKEMIDSLKQEIERLTLPVHDDAEKNEVVRLRKEVRDYKLGVKHDERIIELRKALSAKDKNLKTMKSNLDAWMNRAFELERKLNNKESDD